MPANGMTQSGRMRRLQQPSSAASAIPGMKFASLHRLTLTRASPPRLPCCALDRFRALHASVNLETKPTSLGAARMRTRLEA